MEIFPSICKIGKNINRPTGKVYTCNYKMPPAGQKHQKRTGICIKFILFFLVLFIFSLCVYTRASMSMCAHVCNENGLNRKEQKNLRYLSQISFKFASVLSHRFRLGEPEKKCIFVHLSSSWKIRPCAINQLGWVWYIKSVMQQSLGHANGK